MASDNPSADMLWHPISAWADVGRYVVTALAVLGIMASVFIWAANGRAGPAAPDTDDAVLLDLAPSPASSAPPSDAADGPPQTAMAAAASVPPPVDNPAPRPPAPPPEAIRPDQAAEALHFEPKQPADPKDKAVTPPLPPQTAAAARDERAPSGTKVQHADPLDGTASRRRAARALTLWQHALLTRLEHAKAGVHWEGQTGTVSLAFTIDRRGRLLESHVARGSGFPRIDGVALALLQRAAPFPAPPATLPDEALSFTVPVAFARHR